MQNQDTADYKTAAEVLRDEVNRLTAHNSVLLNCLRQSRLYVETCADDDEGVNALLKNIDHALQDFWVRPTNSETV